MTTVLEEIQETKQEQQDLTIDEIIPKWSHLFDLMNSENLDYEEINYYREEHTLEIGEHDRCVAGEAHKFDHGYSISHSTQFCKTCDRYADSYFLDLYDEIERRHYVGKDWRNDAHVQDFVAHWNYEHKEVTKQQ